MGAAQLETRAPRPACRQHCQQATATFLEAFRSGTEVSTAPSRAGLASALSPMRLPARSLGPRTGSLAPCRSRTGLRERVDRRPPQRRPRVHEQLQVSFISAHNRLVDRLRADGAGEDELFDEARRSLSWHARRSARCSEPAVPSRRDRSCPQGAAPSPLERCRAVAPPRAGQARRSSASRWCSRASATAWPARLLRPRAAPSLVLERPGRASFCSTLY